jgi:hypothetical protein
VRFEVDTPDLRPAVALDHVRDASIAGLAVQGNPEAISALRFVDAQDVLVTGPRVLGSATAFLEVAGAGSRAITVDGGDISKAATPVSFDMGAEKNAVKARI